MESATSQRQHYAMEMEFRSADGNRPLFYKMKNN